MEPKTTVPLLTHPRQGLTATTDHPICNEDVGRNIQEIVQMIRNIADHLVFDVFNPAVDVGRNTREALVASLDCDRRVAARYRNRRAAQASSALCLSSSRSLLKATCVKAAALVSVILPFPVRFRVPLTCENFPDSESRLIAVLRQGMTKVGIVAHRSQPAIGTDVVGDYTADEVF